MMTRFFLIPNSEVFMSNLIARSGFAPANLAEAVEFSTMLAKSSMVPKQYQGKPEDILVAVQWGYEIGLAPMQSLQNISVINGRPSVYGDAAMALVQASAVCEDIEESIEGEGTQNPIAVCIAHRKGRKPVTAKFSVEDAKRAGLWGKQGPWTQYPKRMLQMRARGFALRDAFPDVLKGLITAEEAGDIPVAVSAYSPSETVLEPVKAIEAVSQDNSHLKYKLYLPGGEVYSAHETVDVYIEEYANMVSRIRNSAKLSDEDKQLKISDLREANNDTRRMMEPQDVLRLSQRIGSNVPHPKQKAPTLTEEFVDSDISEIKS
jgi:RecT family